jgi:hypothetical protein
MIIDIYIDTPFRVQAPPPFSPSPLISFPSHHHPLPPPPPPSSSSSDEHPEQCPTGGGVGRLIRKTPLFISKFIYLFIFSKTKSRNREINKTESDMIAGGAG